MKILAIDTSCDDASVAVSENDRLLANCVSSQIPYHSQWGGVVPSIAKRRHQETIDLVINRALKLSGVAIDGIDVFAVTYGPGLAVALEVGVEKAKQLALTYGKKLVAVNHMAGHIYANFALNRHGVSYSGIDGSSFPLLALLISGGHTELVFMPEHFSFNVIGKTVDDAIGEAYDKVARMLNLGYPGGPIVELLGREGDRNAFPFAVPMRQVPTLDYSFSGLKTAVLRKVQELGEEGKSLRDQYQPTVEGDFSNDLYTPALSKKPTYSLDKKIMSDIAASFEKTSADALILKLMKALKDYPVKAVVLGGGVVHNRYIRSRLRMAVGSVGLKMYYPKNKNLITDNAGMIAVAAYYQAIKGDFCDPQTLERDPNLSL